MQGLKACKWPPSVMSWVLYQGPTRRKKRTDSFKLASDLHMRSVVCPSWKVVWDPWSWSYRRLWAAWCGVQASYPPNHPSNPFLIFRKDNISVRVCARAHTRARACRWAWYVCVWICVLHEVWEQESHLGCQAFEASTFTYWAILPTLHPAFWNRVTKPRAHWFC